MSVVHSSIAVFTHINALSFIKDEVVLKFWNNFSFFKTAMSADSILFTIVKATYRCSNFPLRKYMLGFLNIKLPLANESIGVYVVKYIFPISNFSG